ncbi:MAG TPA: four helix bundle protein [Thermoanaerobaculia bacterium]
MKRLVRCFEDLIAWQKAIDLAVVVYEVSEDGPFTRNFFAARPGSSSGWLRLLEYR